ncbi:MAG: hypothetical protein ACR2K1_13695 [Saprospiraceae bacterium]
MHTHTLPAPPNPYVAQRLLDLLQESEMAYRLRGVAHSDYLRRRAHQYKGQTRRELNRIVDLGPDAGRLVDYFLKEFGA